MLPEAGNGLVLDFDIENRPLSYWQIDTPTADITSIASLFIEDGKVLHDTIEVLLLAPPCYHEGHYPTCPDRPDGLYTTDEILAKFVERYNHADMVTGHFIRGHDLPIVNGQLYEAKQPLLRSIMSSDTKLDMFKKSDIPATQEFLVEHLDPKCELGITLEKFHMTQGMWREANRLTPTGIELTRRRVSSDIHAHAHMRQAMLDAGWLRGPRAWRPGGGLGNPGYSG